MQFNVTSVTLGSISDAIKSIYPHTNIFSYVYTPDVALNILKILFHCLTSQMMNYIKPTSVKKIKLKAPTRK